MMKLEVDPRILEPETQLAKANARIGKLDQDLTQLLELAEQQHELIEKLHKNLKIAQAVGLELSKRVKSKNATIRNQSTLLRGRTQNLNARNRQRLNQAAGVFQDESGSLVGSGTVVVKTGVQLAADAGTGSRVNGGTFVVKSALAPAVDDGTFIIKPDVESQVVNNLRNTLQVRDDEIKRLTTELKRIADENARLELIEQSQIAAAQNASSRTQAVDLAQKNQEIERLKEQLEQKDKQLQMLNVDNERKLIALDWDDTLAPLGEKAFFDGAEKFLNMLIAKGYKVVIITGRNESKPTIIETLAAANIKVHQIYTPKEVLTFGEHDNSVLKLIDLHDNNAERKKRFSDEKYSKADVLDYICETQRYQKSDLFFIDDTDKHILESKKSGYDCLQVEKRSDTDPRPTKTFYDTALVSLSLGHRVYARLNATSPVGIALFNLEALLATEKSEAEKIGYLSLRGRNKAAKVTALEELVQQLRTNNMPATDVIKFVNDKHKGVLTSGLISHRTRDHIAQLISVEDKAFAPKPPVIGLPDDGDDLRFRM